MNQRAELLDTSNLLETASLDAYEFLRDAYLQRRRNLVHDGAPPREKDDDGQPQPKPRASSPFPSSAEGSIEIFSMPLPTQNALEQSPARAEAGNNTQQTAAPASGSQAPLPVTNANETAAPAKPQQEVTLPTEPTGAGAAATQAHTSVRILRVWTPATQ